MSKERFARKPTNKKKEHDGKVGEMEKNIHHV
jgi:hypothetical protein